MGNSVADGERLRLGAREVWSDSFGRLGADDLVGGIIDIIAPAICLRRSVVCGDDSLCLAGREVVKQSLL